MFDYNNLPLQDFEGFSSSQMHQIIYFPFDDSCPIKLNRNIPVNESPIFMIALDLLLLLKENRIKLTKLGNIPTKIVKELYDKKNFTDSLVEKGLYKIRLERDWLILHTVKIVLQLAGLTKKQREVLSLTKKGETLLNKEDYTGLFFEFLKAYTQKFNWEYNDYIDVKNVGQLAFLYSLFLLNKYGSEYKLVDFYTDLYLKAFPIFLSQFEESKIRFAYDARFISKFAEWFGFAETKTDNSNDSLFGTTFIRSSNLLKAIMK
ncbi:MAG: hypothetical protein K8F60_18475 [Melioribacteraceae bacterium]|nr:hypothetical protein [Melioribacteraceae bacterium]